MTHVTCRLTAKNRDQLRNPALGNRVWATFTFFCCRYIKGFITRAGEPTDENQRFIRYMKYNYLTTLKKKLPSSVLDKSWPASPVALQQVNFKAVQVMKSLHDPPGVRNKWRVIVDNVRQYDREQAEMFSDADRRSTETRQRSRCPADCCRRWVRRPGRPDRRR